MIATGRRLDDATPSGVIVDARPGAEVAELARYRTPLTRTVLGTIWDPGSGVVSRCALNADGSVVAGAIRPRRGEGLPNFAVIWNVADGRQREFVTPPGEIRDLAFIPGTRRLVTASKDGSVKLWDIDTGEEVCTLAKLDQPAEKIACSDDGTLVTVGFAGDVAAMTFSIEGR